MLLHKFNRSFTMLLIVFAMWMFGNTNRSSYTPTDRHATPVVDVYISASLYSTYRTLMMDVNGGNIYRWRPNGSLSASVVAMLLLISGIESNPGPQTFIGSLNARSIVQRGPLIQDLITSHNLDALAVCESWIVADDPDAVKYDAVPSGFRIHHVPRSTATRRSRGGGLCFIHRDTLYVKPHPIQRTVRYTSFEYQLLTMSNGAVNHGGTVAVVNIYRPPDASMSSFLYELSDLLARLGNDIENDRVVICGDFNGAGATSTTIDADLQSLFDVNGMTQQVTSPTRHSTHSPSTLLDLVVCRAGSGRISSVKVCSSYISDHDLVTWSIDSVAKFTRSTVTYKFRSLKKIDFEKFRIDMKNSALFTSPAESAEQFAEQLDSVTTAVLDRHCPLQTRTKFSSLRRDNHWLSTEAVNAKRERRRLERKWKTHHEANDRIKYRAACRSANEAIMKSRRQMYAERFLAADSNPHRKWSVIRDVLHTTQAPEIMTPVNSKLLCDSLAEFFVTKIRNISSNILSRISTLGRDSDALYADPKHTGEFFSIVQPPSVDEVHKLINSMSGKSSPVDKVPTSIIKSCADVFAPLIAHLAKLSFQDGVFPTAYKFAHVTPLLKKPDLDRDNPANYRPISNLHTISKILERIFLSKIIAFIERSPNYNRHQSAYRRGYSTETAIVRLLNDVYSAADNGSRSLLLLLDLSAAFDCINHDTLLRRLENTFGITGNVLLWLRSYVNNRSQSVRVGGETSIAMQCESGVPQGSVLGPLLFTLYVSPAANVISRYAVNHLQYADDTQLYIALRNDAALTAVSECFNELHWWYSFNGLQLNPDKSEAIQIGTQARLRHEPAIREIKLNEASITLAPSTKSLGVTIDSKLTLSDHVNNVCKAAHYHVRALRHVRKYVSEDIAKSIATSLVGARLDYCNAVLYGTSRNNIDKLQRVQNTLARIVKLRSKYDHITPLLSELHWLPIDARIHHKIAVLTFKAVSTRKPDYLAELVSFHKPTRELRSSSRRPNLLQVPNVKTVFGSRAFCHAAPAVWNSLPTEIMDTALSLATFKSRLKSHLYNQSFRC
jgi:Reverse transcriptase (RNA-dependent DNA polymerase)/Endonuclease-reverse transcriptase